MLNKYSWTTLAIWLFVILSVYYLYVLLAYYRRELFSIFLELKKFKIKETVHIDAMPSDDNNKIALPTKSDSPDNNSFTLIHELLEDFKILFAKASKTKMIKEELMQAIASRLKTYPALFDTELVDDINIHLVMEAKEQCQTDLSKEDLKQIWAV